MGDCREGLGGAIVPGSFFTPPMYVNDGVNTGLEFKGGHTFTRLFFEEVDQFQANSYAQQLVSFWSFSLTSNRSLYILKLNMTLLKTKISLLVL